MSSINPAPESRQSKNAVVTLATKNSEVSRSRNTWSTRSPEIAHAIDSEKIQEEEDRGSGRVAFNDLLTASAKDASDPQQESETRLLKLLVIGSRQDVISNIKTLHYLRYAHATDWSKLQQGPNPGEMMSILTVRVAR